jgi:CheY-like chemotaxis protein
VILDVQMPGINGLEVERHLTPTSVPVIVVTTHDDPAIREIALASGAAGYPRKPFNDVILIKAVEMGLGGTPRP